MDGHHHRIFAPIFTFGVAQLMYQTGITSPEIGQMGVFLASAASLITATTADADLYASYPTVAILDAKPYRKRNGYYHYRKKDGKIGKYRPPKKRSTRYVALFMKAIGVRKHRDWRTHAPTVFFPLGFLIIKLTNVLQLSGSLAIYTATAQAIIIGMVLGYLSHIVADIPNKGGVPLGPSNRQYSITKAMFGNKLSGFFRSSNKVWNTLFIAIAIDLVFFIINKDLAMTVNLKVFNLIMMIVKPILNVIKNVFVTLLG